MTSREDAKRVRNNQKKTYLSTNLTKSPSFSFRPPHFIPFSGFTKNTTCLHLITAPLSLAKSRASRDHSRGSGNPSSKKITSAKGGQSWNPESPSNCRRRPELDSGSATIEKDLLNRRKQRQQRHGKPRFSVGESEERKSKGSTYLRQSAKERRETTAMQP